MRIAALAVALAFWTIVIRRWQPRSVHARFRLRAVAHQGGPARPLVSIILPARNEEACIEACVRSLLAQDYGSFEVIAVDDCSDDGTRAILGRMAAGDSRLKVIHGTPVPPDWMGKAHAVVQGFRATRGEWLLFTDADTEHAPWLLSAVMAKLAGGNAAFATAFGWQRHPTWAVRLVNLAVSTVLFVVLDPRGLENPRSRISGVNGQYMIVSREAYEAIGTHAAVRHYSSTDVSLGYLAKLQGWMGRVFFVGDGLQTTMYRSVRDAFQGWSRSLVNAAWTALGPVAGSAAVVASIAAMLAVWVAPWVLVWRGLLDGDVLTVAAGLLIILAGLALMRLRGRMPWAIRAAAMMPVATVVLAAIGCTGLIKAWARGGTVWKGRIVRTAEALPRWRPHAPTPRPQR